MSAIWVATRSSRAARALLPPATAGSCARRPEPSPGPSSAGATLMPSVVTAASPPVKARTATEGRSISAVS